jgi:hypothetical protein
MKITLLSIILLLLSPIILFANNANTNSDLIKVGSVTNEIKIGSMIGNRNLEFGIKNIVEELLMDMNYDISEKAELSVNIRLVFFDVINVGKSIGVYHKGVATTRIIAIGELEKGGKIIKKTQQKGESTEISTSTLIIGEDGSLNQQTASIALKKLCELIIIDLLK